jgi:hypothetical protein
MSQEELKVMLCNKDKEEKSVNKKMMMGIIIKQVLNHLRYDAEFKNQIVNAGIVDEKSELFEVVKKVNYPYVDKKPTYCGPDGSYELLLQKAVYTCSFDNLSHFVASNVLRRIFILASDLFLIDGYYPLNVFEESKSDEAIVKAQCFYYKQLLLMIRYCYLIEVHSLDGS